MPTARRAPTVLTAYVLHRYDWSESSLILDVLTREQGRLAVVAKGAKRPYSQLRPVLLPFQRLQIALGRVPRVGTEPAEAAADVQTLRSAEWAGDAAMLTGAALFSGFYLNELLMRLLARNDPHPALFDAYAQTLPCLGTGNASGNGHASGNGNGSLSGAGIGRAPAQVADRAPSADDVGVQAALRAFELVLLRETGVLPDLGVDTSTLQRLNDAPAYRLLPDSGLGDAPAGESGIAGAVWTSLEAALRAQHLAAVQQACTAALGELRPMLRNLVHYHLGSSVLRTRQVMLEVQALER